MYREALDRYVIKNYHLVELKAHLQTLKKNTISKEELNKSTQMLLENIDMLAEGLKDDYPRFYHEYISAKNNLNSSVYYPIAENLSIW